MIQIRPQKVSDAKRFYEILQSPNFIYFPVKPLSIEDEKIWLRQNKHRRKKNTEWNYTIIYRRKIVGAIGVKINIHRNHIGEIGYFLDEIYWGRGITSEAVKLVEDICWQDLGLRRLEIVMRPENRASERVAIKNHYQKEGLLKKLVRGDNDQLADCFLYAKVR